MTRAKERRGRELGATDGEVVGEVVGSEVID